MADVYFADTSALSKRYVVETGTAWLRGIFAPATDCSIYIVRITAVEMIAAITRRERGATLAPLDASAARTAFQTHLNTEYRIIEVTESLINQAMALAEKRGLRGYDAVQLAAAMEVSASYRAAGLPPVVLVSADAELNAAAASEGLPVEDPNDHP